MSNGKDVMGGPPKDNSNIRIWMFIALIVVAIAVIIFWFNQTKTVVPTPPPVVTNEPVKPSAKSDSIPIPIQAEVPAKQKVNQKIQPQGNIHTVIKGEYLWKIASQRYSDPFKWRLIYDANRENIQDPNLILINQKLIIP